MAVTSRIIATLAIVGTVFTSSFGTAHAGVLFEVVKSVGKEIVHKAVADKQEREMRAYQQQRAQQRRAQQQRTAKHTAAQAVQAQPVEAASGATATPTANSSGL
jgi:hypothetical protein